MGDGVTSIEGVRIRDATAADLPCIVDLLQQESLGDERREDPGPPLPDAYVRAFEAIEADPRQRLLVAEVGGEVVGTFVFIVIPNLSYRGRPVAQVENVVVDEPWRGRGVGEAMMRWAIEEARRAGCFRVQLTSNKARKDAHRFYERLGFVATHEGFKLYLS
ncbi:MAG TPA: GNAT family N-acetyltransferase [Dehalococcoidia bacterium]|nr:GNAT family N-acetyltransferase [Dehalococcoidia bacterium]